MYVYTPISHLNNNVKSIDYTDFKRNVNGELIRKDLMNFGKNTNKELNVNTKSTSIITH